MANSEEVNSEQGVAKKPKSTFVTKLAWMVAGTIILVFVYFTLMVTPGGIGHIKMYESYRTKKEVRESIDTFLANHPNRRVGGDLRAKIGTAFYISPNDSINRAHILNVDSLNWYFYFPERGIVLWGRIPGDPNGWASITHCELGFAGVVNASTGMWRFDKDIRSQEEKELETLLEAEVFSKLSVPMKRE